MEKQYYKIYLNLLWALQRMQYKLSWVLQLRSLIKFNIQKPAIEKTVFVFEWIASDKRQQEQCKRKCFPDIFIWISKAAQNPGIICRVVNLSQSQSVRV